LQIAPASARALARVATDPDSALTNGVNRPKTDRLMLHEFIAANRAEIIARCSVRASACRAAHEADVELLYGVPHFLDQLGDALRSRAGAGLAIACSATKHGTELSLRGFTLAQVVQDYGGICQVITALSGEQAAHITSDDFQMLNACLDDAIAGAITEHARMRDHDGAERRGRFAHELRNQLNSALLSYEVLAAGEVGFPSTTGSLLGRSLTGLEAAIEREMAGV